MLDIEEAARLAQRFLDEETGPGDAPLALVAEERAQVGGLYYFGCQSVAYLRSGEFRDMAIGMAGVSVDAETGACRVLGAVEAAELDLF
ncbi:YrhB domain-containing protein [Streptomyces shenzhenensis]|uniref:YrhB domain-containing protein n=1 Tax=Streptomyces shenzhenensis TaxID=943815 RepID=UPI001F33DA99|nr:YrhB domain-containing protein [Streptomyces shenzhenensis]